MTGRHTPRPNIRRYETLLHIVAWLLLFGSSFLFIEQGADGQLFFNWRRVIHNSLITCFCCLIFYLNYLWLIPRYFFDNGKGQFFTINILLVTLLSVAAHFIFAATHHMMPFQMPADIVPTRGPAPPMPVRWLFVVRTAIFLALFIAAALAISVLSHWRMLQAQVREERRRRTEAELTYLRNQVNPHFMLNTLNNIYALIQVDADRARQAIIDLSRLMRYVLYEKSERVPLLREVEFMKHYIELMRIRLADGVRLTVSFDVADDCATQVVPMLFISLIENAFKHGISPVSPSFIDISIAEHDGVISCRINNSNYPKSGSDRSGSGIGLEQVRRRLELTYPGRYSWTHGMRPAAETGSVQADGTRVTPAPDTKADSIYTSILTIRTRR